MVSTDIMSYLSIIQAILNWVSVTSMLRLDHWYQSTLVEYRISTRKYHGSSWEIEFCDSLQKCCLGWIFFCAENMQKHADFYFCCFSLKYSIIFFMFFRTLFISEEFSCFFFSSISHTEDKISARGGILRWLAKKRLRDTMKLATVLFLMPAYVYFIGALLGGTWAQPRFADEELHSSMFETLSHNHN